MKANLVMRAIWAGVTIIGGLAMMSGCSRTSPPSPPQASQVALAAPAAVPPAPVIKAAAAEPASFKIQSVLAPDAPIGAGDYVWNADGVPSGPILIAVDLEAQRLYAYRGGVEIGRSSILYGADDKPTPIGTFPILEKDKDHVSNLYGAPMPYMLRLTMDGVAIHGSEVEDGSATHGCIGVPDEFAALLFEEVRLGDRVIVAKKWMREVYYPKRDTNRTA